MENSILTKEKKSYKMIVMGASTGGPNTVLQILKALPSNFPIGIALVQHIKEGYDLRYANWLNDNCSLSVRLAKNNDTINVGEVVVAPVGQHLIFKNKKLFLENSPAILNQKPAVDKLFSSAAISYKDKLIAVLLTGMGSDGAEGAVAIKNNGGFTIIQDKESSVIFGMPRVAIKKGGASMILPYQKIADYLIDITSEKE